jgi:hypothetical protein
MGWEVRCGSRGEALEFWDETADDEWKGRRRGVATA